MPPSSVSEHDGEAYLLDIQISSHNTTFAVIGQEFASGDFNVVSPDRPLFLDTEATTPKGIVKPNFSVEFASTPATIIELGVNQFQCWQSLADSLRQVAKQWPSMR